MRSISALPCLATILEDYRVRVSAFGFDFDSPRKMTSDTQGLGSRIDRSTLYQSNDLVCSIINNNIKGIISTDPIFVALVLDDVHGTPAGSEAWSWVDRFEDTESEGRCPNFWDAACVCDTATLVDFCLLAELAVLTVSSLVDESLYVEVFPVVEVRKLQDRVVKTIFRVTVDAASLGVLYRNYAKKLVLVCSRNTGQRRRVSL